MKTFKLIIAVCIIAMVAYYGNTLSTKVKQQSDEVTLVEIDHANTEPHTSVTADLISTSRN